MIETSQTLDVSKKSAQLSENEAVCGKLHLGGIPARCKRIWELDFLRGIAIILMVIDHLMYDVAYIFSDAWIKSSSKSAGVLARFAMNWWGKLNTYPFDVSAIRDSVQGVVLWLFFGLCGTSVYFSKNNPSRVIKIMVFAAIITIATTSLNKVGVLGASDVIIFGVLHMLAVSSLIVSIIYTVCMQSRKYGELLFPVICIALSLLIFKLDDVLFNMDILPDENLLFLHVKFAGKHYMGDYFPLLPNLGIVLAGAAIGPLLYRKKKVIPAKIRRQMAPTDKFYRQAHDSRRHSASIGAIYCTYVDNCDIY